MNIPLLEVFQHIIFFSPAHRLQESLMTFGEISGIALLIVLKRVDLFSESTHNISIAYLLENRDRTFRIGQSSIRVYFFRFSCNCKLFISNNNYLKVSRLHLRNLLFINIKNIIFALSK